MSRYQDSTALRRGLEVRLKNESDTSGTDLGRLRRRVVFDRVAVRLAAVPEGCWILKGGAAMEFRLLDRARMTKDLDLVIRTCKTGGAEVRESLIDALTADPDQDGFTFRVSSPAALMADRAGRPAWRFSVEAWLAGKLFAGVRLDIAARDEEPARTEFLQLPGTLAFAGVPARSIEAVDRAQHFAEKLHALTREYLDRPNSRIKDLADLVLLIGQPRQAVVVEPAVHLGDRPPQGDLTRRNGQLPDGPTTSSAEPSARSDADRSRSASRSTSTARPKNTGARRYRPDHESDRSAEWS